MLGSYCSTTVWKCTGAIRTVPSILLSTIALVVILGASSFAAEVVTDSTVYDVGSIVGIDGFTFGSGETVTLQVTELDGTPITGDAGLPWDATSDGTGDFGTSWILDYQGTSSELSVTAVGHTSGLVATTSFVAGATNLDQLQNGTETTPPEWSNGNINSSNSCYSEGAAVPYRAFIRDEGSGTPHYFTIEMEWTKAGIHAFDFLGSYDFSEDSAIDLAGGPCGNVGTSAPEDCTDPADSLEFPDPTLTSNYSGSIPSDFYTTVNPTWEYNDIHYLMAYNAVIDSVGDYYFGGTALNRTWAVEVYYTQVDTGTVGFYWGGHLAQGDPDHWGYGNGSASVSGAPYHMRMKSFDGGGGAGQDRSIQNGTICLPPAAIIIIDADSLCFDIDTTYIAYDTSDANDWLWRVTGGTIIGDSTLSSVEFSVDSTASTVTIELVACNTNGGCPGDFCCTDVTLTLPTASCNHPPEVYCAADDSLFVCELSDICVTGFTSYDADGDALTCTVWVNDQVDNIDGDSVCFTPVEGDNVITYICTDPYGAADTCETLIHVDLNSPPTASCPPSDTVFLCELPPTYCLDGFSCDDPDGNVVSSTVNGVPFGGGQYCFTPVEGDNNLQLICVDACGETDTCQTTITVRLNSAPVADAGPDQSVFLAEPAEICWPASCSDVDGNLTGCALVEGPGIYDNTNICFTTDTPGVYVFVLEATDDCAPGRAIGYTDRDTAVITVTYNSPPVATCPGDTSIFLCELSEICIPGFSCSDVDGNLASCVSSIGTLVGDTVCFTPTGVGVYTITLIATDSLGVADTCATNVTVTVNSPPVASCPGDTALFVCDLSPICITGFNCSDVDGNLASCVPSIGTLVGDVVCFTPTAEGAYDIILTATDDCDEVHACTTQVTVDLNEAPVCDNCPTDDTVFVCDLSEICIGGFEPCFDPDYNLDYCYASPGTLTGSTVCLDPVEGDNTILFICVDSCDAADTCETVIHVVLNSAPVVTCPPNDSMFLCNLSDTCISGFSSYDPDDNLDYCYAIGGTLNGDTVCFTPVAGANTITYVCVDSCGDSAYCQTTIWVDTNSAPVAGCPGDTTLFVCDLTETCLSGFSCTDVDGNLKSCVATGGTLNGNQVCFTPTGEGAYDIILTATDACDEVHACTTQVTVTLNRPPEVTCPDDSTIVTCHIDNTVCVYGFSATDPDGNLKSVTLNGQPYTPGTEYCFVPDSGLNYLVLVAVDSCDASAVCTTIVDVVAEDPEVCISCPIVTIEKTHGTIQGQHELVDVTIDSLYNLPDGGMGGYDFLIAFDASALALQAVIPGPPFYDPVPNGCGWEYFIYRFGPCGSCASGCPTGMVRVFGLAETNNGPNHPDCFEPDPQPATLFTLDFLVTNDRTFECQYIPIYFFWCDCADNTISDSTGNHLYLDEIIYDFEGRLIWDEDDDDEFPEDARIPWVGAPDYCIDPDPGKPTPIRCLDFWNGGIDIVCADSIDARGDINLNGTSNEIADAVLFSNYFVKGISVFNVNVNGQIAASDVNADGLTLSVADLVYLIRIIVGDAAPYFKQAPLVIKTDLTDGVLSVGASLGAAWVVLDGEHEPELLAPQMEMKYHYDAESDLTRILVYSMKKGHTFDGAFLAGLEGKVVTFEAATYEGAPVAARLVPDQFALHQCYPNPFNPTTTISFALAEASDYKLTVYNTLGREVQSFTGHGQPGIVEIQWNADGHASGIYFYRLTAGDFTDTKKMVLLK